MEHTLVVLISILVFGIGAQWLSWRLRIPSILTLLLFGFLAGPVTGYLHPDGLLGNLLFPWVSISVAIILFEGGLSLRLSELEKIGKVVRNMISVGILITWVLVTLGAKYLLNFDWGLALLLGAIMTVTGPTVIMPLLRSLRLSDRMSSVLKWEAMLNDPIGAILAVLVFEGLLAQGFEAATSHTIIGLVKTVVVGIGLGVTAAWLMKFLLKRYWIPDFLQNAFTLMMVLSVFGISNLLQAESGLVAVTIMGVMLANQKAIMVKHIVEFKENLRVLLISSLFIVLGARLQFSHLADIGFPHFLFIVFMIFIVRPLAVFASTIGSDLSWKEKVFLSWLAPRGIVAAAVASIFALHLEQSGYANASNLLSVTFLVIICTVAVYGLTAPLVAKFLNLAEPNPQGVLIAGGHDWARLIAKKLQEFKFRVLMIDINAINVRLARSMGVPAIRRDILSESLVDEVELNGIGRFLGLTPNNEVNSLAAIHFAEVFGRSEVFQLTPVDKDTQTPKEGTSGQRGRPLFGEKVTYARLEDMFEHGATIEDFSLTEDYTYEKFQQEYGDAFVLFVVTESEELKIITTEQQYTPKPGSSLIAVVPKK